MLQLLAVVDVANKVTNKEYSKILNTQFCHSGALCIYWYLSVRIGKQIALFKHSQQENKN